MMRIKVKTPRPMMMNGSLNGGGFEIVASSALVPTIRVRVNYGVLMHEIHISSQTRLHTQDQKLLFTDKKRDSNVYLDMEGVKDKSKIVLIKDPTC
ncbi:hypothetical protein AMTRI_Chr13g90830 [Amborella trichopoda]